MKEKLNLFWIWVTQTVFGRKRRDAESRLNFEIAKRKDLEHRVSTLEVVLRRLNFDVARKVDEKIANYEKLFTASKQYGDNLIKVAIKANEKIVKGEKK